MSWVQGTATDYKDLLDQLREIATSDGCTVAAINAGGTGYAVGDILTVSGGTSTHVAKLRVTSVASGVIDGIVVDQGGAYTSAPSNPVSVTGGTGTGATLNLTFASSGWTQRVWNQEALSATVAAGGSGYTNGDVLTLSGGTATTAAQFTATVSAGAVTSVVLLTAGDYDTIPSNPVSVTGGTGTGATLTVTWQDASGERTLILDGSGSGSDNIIVGVRTYQTAATGPNPSETRQELCYNWGMLAADSFSSGSLWYAQTNICPGFTGAGALGTVGGAYVPLKGNDGVPMTFYISATPSRIYGAVRLSNGGSIVHYASFYIGFRNRYGSSGDQPYPIHVAGTTAYSKSHWRDKELARCSGIVQCSGLNGVQYGPTMYKRAGTTWQEVKNIIERHSTQPTRDITNDYTIYPYGRQAIRNASHVGLPGNLACQPWNTWIPFPPIGTGTPGSATVERYILYPTPDGANGERMLVPATLVAATASEEGIIGEMDGVYWVSSYGLTTEDYIDDANDQRYRVFMTGNQKERYHIFALKEA